MFMAIAMRKKLALGVFVSFSLLATPLIHAQTTPTPVPIKPDVPYVPTPESVVMEMLKIGNVTANDVVYDLGSGDGRLVITAVQKFGAKRGVGVEINPGLVNKSNENAKQAGVSDRVQFLQQDLFKTNFQEASVVTLYLLPKINLELRPKLLSELKPGTRVVSHAFGMGDWRPDRTILVQDGGRPRTIFLWVIPAIVSGTWQGSVSTQSGSPQTYQVQVDQTFQNVRATVDLGGQRISIPRVLVNGDRISFEQRQPINGQDVNIRFNGQVNADMLKGVAEVRTGRAIANYNLTAQRQPVSKLPNR
ncbi:class I SAM-dependent methyltransferase [Phormidesmis sp. 146-33]